METEFEQDLHIDASLVAAGFSWGQDKFFAVAMSLGLSGPNEATRRAEWLKKQPEDYIAKVTEQADKMLAPKK